MVNSGVDIFNYLRVHHLLILGICSFEYNLIFCTSLGFYSLKSPGLIILSIAVIIVSGLNIIKEIVQVCSFCQMRLIFAT